MLNSITLNDTKGVWGDYEIWGDNRTALFATPAGASISPPDPTHFVYRTELTSWGSRAYKMINDSDRTLSLPVIAEGAKISLDLMNDLYKSKYTAPFKIISLDPDSYGDVLHEYDFAILASSPNIATISDASASETNLDFSVGSDPATRV